MTRGESDFKGEEPEGQVVPKEGCAYVDIADEGSETAENDDQSIADKYLAFCMARVHGQQHETSIDADTNDRYHGMNE